MAPAQMPSSQHSAAPDHQGLTPPDSPIKEWASSQATMEILKLLFNVLGKVLPDLKEPPSTPVFPENPQPGPDLVQLGQLLQKFNRDRHFPAAVVPTLCCSVSNEQSVINAVADDTDLGSPICTTPDDFKTFEKWASTRQDDTVQPRAIAQTSLLEYKRISERYDSLLTDDCVIADSNLDGMINRANMRSSNPKQLKATTVMLWMRMSLSSASVWVCMPVLYQMTVD